MFTKHTVLQAPFIEVIWPQKSLTRDVAIIVETSLLLALAAQIAIPLPFSPVPITLQTLIVVLAGAVLGSRLGALSVCVYIAEGTIGLPFFAKGAAGIAYLRGVTGGYLVGFVFAAFIVGVLVERGLGRKFSTAVIAMVAGNILIYAFGLSWLARVLNVPLGQTLTPGLYPFILGDLYKIGLASVFLPVLWKFFGKPKCY